MTFVAFLKHVEIQTKIASLFPFFIGNLFAAYYFEKFSFSHALVMFVSLLCIDMATTALNNYMDYKRAVKKHGYNFEIHNAIVNYKLSESGVVITILLLLAVGMGMGLLLVLMTDWVVLLIGMASFAVGIVYSFGPLPISRTPFGELFSGFFMGFFIVFLSVYIHLDALELIHVVLSTQEVQLIIQWQELLMIGLYSLPLILGISNIMLANNICDMDDDFENKRYTLPILIGKPKALFIFKWSYMLALLMIPVFIVLGIWSWYGMFALIIIKPIGDCIRDFKREQKKETTFVNAVKAFTIISLMMALMTLIHLLIRIIL